MSPRIVVYDACILHPPAIRDVLIRLADAGLVRARWTDRILDELFHSIRKRRPDLDEGRLLQTRQRMCDAIPDCLVVGYEGLADAVELPDPDDRHVLEAAIRCSARTIVTANLKDFPGAVLAPLGIEAVHPDQFLLDLLGDDHEAVLRVVEEQARALRSPPVDLPTLLDTLASRGLVRFAAAMRNLTP